MTIAIGNDHAGYALKVQLMEMLKDKYEFTDYGCYSAERYDYPDAAEAVANAIVEGKHERGILIDLLSRQGFGFAIVAGLILAGILASTMSTADSQLLAASSSVSQNILYGVFHINIFGKASMIAARLTLVGIAIVAAFLARDPDSSVFQIVSFAWAGFGAAFGPVVLFSLFWRRSNRWGALAGMLSGGAMVFIWKYLVRPLGGAWNVYELLPAFIVASIMIVVVSLLTPAPSKEITDEFDQVASMH